MFTATVNRTMFTAFFLMLCWAVVAMGGETDSSATTLYNFVSACNGLYNDLDQFRGAEGTFGQIQLLLMPIDAKKYFPNPMYYAEERYNGFCTRQELHEVTVTNGVIHCKVYNFTDVNRPDCMNLDKAAMSNLKPEDLQSKPECTLSFTENSPGVFKGIKPDCKTLVNGKHPDYEFTVTCDAVFASIPPASPELTAPAPYKLALQGSRYDACNLPPDFKGPCDKN